MNKFPYHGVCIGCYNSDAGRCLKDYRKCSAVTSEWGVNDFWLNEKEKNMDNGVNRDFESGATRDTADGKLDFEGFLSHPVLHQYAKYMNMNRLQSDGKLRASDNWQKGIPMDVYMKSLYRHFMEMWEYHRMAIAPNRDEQVEGIASMCGLMFNIMGYLHEWLKDNEEIDFDREEPTAEMLERLKKIKQDIQNEHEAWERGY
jgi:hypothetical protein